MSFSLGKIGTFNSDSSPSVGKIPVQAGKKGFGNLRKDLIKLCVVHIGLTWWKGLFPQRKLLVDLSIKALAPQRTRGGYQNYVPNWYQSVLKYLI